jgi:hypothetical protein
MGKAPSVKNLYKRLNIDESAAEQQVREALQSPAVALDPQTREAAAFVLLNPDRRAAYDRTHRVLWTVGQLRSHLGLNLKPFWARGRFKDYTVDASPAYRRPPRSIRPADIARAFGLGREPVAVAGASRVRRRVLVAASLLLLAGLAVVGYFVYSFSWGR